MNRDDLAEIARKHGLKKGERPDEKQRQAIRAEIAAKLTENEVREAPRVFGDSGGRPMTAADATDTLVEEVLAMEDTA